MAAVPAIFLPSEFFAGPCAMRGPAPGFLSFSRTASWLFFCRFYKRLSKSRFLFSAGCHRQTSKWHASCFSTYKQQPDETNTVLIHDSS